ncbi:protein-S-isoprenylcysteine O-methyltransferase isoform X1 [Danaus plexippus]|nr:protein-S-isoprenylcysteine O-methyltransferase isoform X1 [Danaus plexippus]
MENVCPAAKQSLLYFALSSIMFVISFFSASVLGYTSELWALTYWGPALYFCLLNFILRYFLKGFTYEVATRAALLGSVFATGLYFATFDNSFHIFGLYAMAISMFHFSEFFTVALTNPQTLTVDSFILNHSSQYWIAAVTSWLEAGVEYYFFPSMKSYFWLSHIGVVMCIVGELFRKVAMFTAKTNFNHHVQTVKKPDHRLVTNGVYSLCRHPSYVGWFYWSIGTQIILLNPVCVVIYTLVSWMFFNERIFAEEMFLISFFGKQYLEYQKRVSTGLPFIKGVVMDGVS